MIENMTLEDYFKEMDNKGLIWIKEGCKTCDRITLRIPHLLLLDMLENCPQSALRDELIYKLQNGDISDNLRDLLSANHIFDKINNA